MSVKRFSFDTDYSEKVNTVGIDEKDFEYREKTYNVIQEPKEFTTPPEGIAISECEVCGVAFNQQLIRSINKYTQFKRCPRHRKIKKGDNEDIDQFALKAKVKYTPHKNQRIIHESKAKYKVINAGARFGKDRATTMEAIAYFIECLNEERRADLIPSVYWWIIAPIEKLAQQNWEELKAYFPKELVVDFSDSNYTIETVYGGRIEVRSAYDPESLVGVGLDIVTITEAARIKDLDAVWSNIALRLRSPGRGVGGTGGIAIINSSPLGRNHFYNLWRLGQENSPTYNPHWESWTFTTWDNPLIKSPDTVTMIRGVPVTEAELLRRELGTRRYNQDVLAKFVGGEVLCFPTFAETCVQYPSGGTFEEVKKEALEWSKALMGESYVVSYDPAKRVDNPVAVVIEERTGRLMKAVNMYAYRSWNSQYDMLYRLSSQYNYAPVAFSRTGHETIEEELEKRGITCITFNEQGANKENFVSHYEVVVENGGIQVFNDGSEEVDELIRQHTDYSRVVKGKTIKFTNVAEPHDDYVDCCYIAFQAISNYMDDSLPFVGSIAPIPRK